MTNDYSVQPTGAGLVAFLDHAIEKGEMKRGTGVGMRTSVKEVLTATEGEDHWATASLDELDVDDVLRRFQTLRAMKYSTDSLATYKSRFRKAVDMFAEFRSNPSGWKPGLRARETRERKSTSTRPPAYGPAAPAMSATPEPRSAVIKYPFPIREGMLASIELPRDLTKQESKRLAAFIEALAVEEIRALPPGRDSAGATTQ